MLGNKSLRSLAACVLCLATAVTSANLPANYDALSNEEKQSAIWQEVQQSYDENGMPELQTGGFWWTLTKLKGMFNLAPSFDHDSDEMPEGRIKIIHTNGSVGKIYLQAVGGHPFTGIYQTGGDGIARLSLATEPADTSFIPGMAVKFFVENHPSINFHVMNDLEGQGSNWNYFAKTFTNKIAHPTSYVLRAIEKIFEWTKSPANELDIAMLAKWSANGEPVEKPLAPEQIYFTPSERIVMAIPSDSRADFRESLRDITMGAMYEVYGELQGKSYHIGTLMLDSQILPSEYGDKNLFFQHQR